ncbi:bifunctional diguanylate cyclase/phosphodiesterase [Mycolicibacterium sp.]|uniref:putative bifunctional diguanylate cyclase/phosphodiesterase n=1 Tax=Mycolicibacterium sp. TaxID=2320850 RepID=UPI001A353937|nr:bifunctional diguanylate cyclase/phosphodiesterase [Mycolicibacterium sp.]MBJ7340876.1 bifunctional diguanylate cyclase/phosphodiesterase [Mycolicibacterium sp.]
MTSLNPLRVAKVGIVGWIAFLGWLLWLRWNGGAHAPVVAQVVSDTAFATFGLFAAGCAVAAAVANGGRARAAWACLAIGIGAWVAAEAAKSLQPLWSQTGMSFPSAADAGFIALPVAVCGALLLLPVGHGRPSAVRLLMDGLIVTGSLFAIGWIVILRGLFESGRTSPTEFAVALAYPVADLVAITIGLLVLIRARGTARLPVALLLGGVVLMAVSNDVYFHLVAHGDYGKGDLLDVGWATSLLSFGLAGLAGCRESRFDRGPVRDSLWLPYVPLSVAGVVVVADLLTPATTVVLSLAVALVIAVLFRQFLVVGHNQRLLAVVADQALRDPLTGLANRSLFSDRLEHAVELHRRELFGALAVLTLDLDDFKLVNDELGHAAGDVLLVEVAGRILDAVRSGDTVARLGGDEFAILIEKGPESPESVAQRVVDAFDEPFAIDGHALSIRPSVGLSIAPARDLDLRADVLLKQSDLAMYAAKRTQASGVQTFAVDTGPLKRLELRSTDRRGADMQKGPGGIELLGDLRRAIDLGELAMVYQPKIDLGDDSGGVVGVEALVRWPHPDHGVLTPADFLPLVRRHDLMESMTARVFEMVFADSVRWRDAGRTIPVAVNLFAPSFDDSDLPRQLNAALSEHGLESTALTLEITEDLVIENLQGTRAVLDRLRECGIRVSIDDFGSGFSGLQYLRELSVDEVKLDQQFVMPILEDRRAASIVHAVIDLAHDLQVTCVAEGVESAPVADRLREYGCDLAQGYYFSPPVEAAELLQMLPGLDPLPVQQ